MFRSKFNHHRRRKAVTNFPGPEQAKGGVYLFAKLVASGIEGFAVPAATCEPRGMEPYHASCRNGYTPIGGWCRLGIL